MAEKSKLSYPVILLITINCIMGTGIFFLPAVGAREAGLFAIISWIIMGLMAFLLRY
jgi:amino acid transporter